MKTMRRETALRVASVLSLVGLGLMMWPMFAPSPLSVVAGMTGGQVLCVISVLIFAAVVVLDLRRHHALDEDEPAEAKLAAKPALQ